MAKTHDTSGSKYAATESVINDEHMGEDEAMAFLSDEERAALEDDDDNDDTADAEQTDPSDSEDQTKPDQGADDERQDDEERSAADGQPQDGKPEAEPEESDGEQAADEEGSESDGLTDDPFVPQYKFDASDIEARQTKLDTDFAEAKQILEKAFTEGEIDDAEYNRRKDAINEIRYTEQRKIDKDAVKAELAAELSQQTTAQTWDHALARFMAENKEIRSSRVLTGAMQAELNAIGEEYAGKQISYTKMLNLAKDRVYKELGRAAPQPDTKVKAVKELAKQRGQKPEVPKTLGDVPSDKLSSGKFDDVESLSGLAFEDAIARMTSDELSEWSR